MRNNLPTSTLIGLLLLLILVACAPTTVSIERPIVVAASPTATESPSEAPTPAGPATPTPTREEVVASFSPLSPMPEPGNMPAGSYMREIQDRGRLIVGVSADVLLFGYLNPATNELEGFDLDIAAEIARAIFGEDWQNHIQWVAVTSADRIPALEEGRVDLIASSMTITASRKLRIHFSEEYYTSGQQLLVPTNSTITGIQDTAGRRICAPAGTTSADNITRLAPQAILVTSRTFAECLALLQRGIVDAVSTDDIILAGLAAQDPFVKIVGAPFSDEPYGLGVALEHPEFVAFINGVLSQMKQDGRWATIYNRWLSSIGPAPQPPTAVYLPRQ